jgi:hypothetical protein
MVSASKPPASISSSAASAILARERTGVRGRYHDTVVAADPNQPVNLP